MPNHDHYGWGYRPGLWFLVFPLFWLTVVAFVAWQFGRAGGRGWGGRRDARSVLAERYARSDTTPDGYRERLSVLKGDQR